MSEKEINVDKLFETSLTALATLIALMLIVWLADCLGVSKTDAMIVYTAFVAGLGLVRG